MALLEFPSIDKAQEHYNALPQFAPQPGQYWDVLWWFDFDPRYHKNPMYHFWIAPMAKAWGSYRGFCDSDFLGGSNPAECRRWVKETCNFYHCTPRYVQVLGFEEAKKWLRLS